MSTKYLVMSILLMIVIVSRANAQATFYVDPDYTGSTRTGSASQPWHSLSDTVTNNPWTTINSSLASGAVNVWFSARKAGSDTDQTSGDALNIDRTNTSINRLYLSGNEFYNANTSSPNWQPYSGVSKYAITVGYAPLNMYAYG